jgi:hypothetical protein
VSDLVAFLKARLDEDEAVAREAGGQRWRWDHGFGAMCNDKDCPYGHLVADGEPPTLLMEVHGFDIHQPWQGAEHIARWDPARVLAEVAAKRAILGIHEPVSLAPKFHPEVRVCARCGTVGEDEIDWPCDTVLALALPYADHPDYDPAWRLS